MRPEIEYQMWVKQPMDAVMAQVVYDASQFGITDEEVNRAVLGWVMDRLAQNPPPEWLTKDLA